MDTESRHSAEMTDDELFDDGEVFDVEEPEQQIEVGGTAQAPDPEPAPPEPATPGKPAAEDPFEDHTDGQPPEAEQKAEDGQKARTDDQEEPEDSEEYGQRVQRRINKEVSRRKAAEERAQRVEAELAKMQGQLGETRSQALDRSIEVLEARGTQLQEQLTKAIEDGDTARQVELTREIGGIDYELRQAQGFKQRLAPQRSEDEGEGGPQPARRPAPQTMTPEQQEQARLQALPPKSRDWVTERDFFNWSESQRAFAMGVDAELTSEGWDVGTDEYYAEMDRRIKATFPDLYESEAPKPKPAPRKQTQQAGHVAPVSTAPAQSAQQRAASGRVTLGPEDFAQMRTFKLDPNNPEHVEQFAREKARSARADT